MRDSQRQRLYDAENEFRKLISYESFKDIEETRKFIEKVWNSKFTRKHFPIVTRHPCPYVADGRGTTWARGGLRRINLPAGWARNKIVALHELSHSVTIHNNIPIHGREFAAAMLLLLNHFIGKKESKLLKQVFRKRGVKFRPKKKIIISFERLEQLRERGRLLAAKRKENANL